MQQHLLVQWWGGGHNHHHAQAAGRVGQMKPLQRPVGKFESPGVVGCDGGSLQSSERHCTLRNTHRCRGSDPASSSA